MRIYERYFIKTATFWKFNLHPFIISSDNIVWLLIVNRKLPLIFLSMIKALAEIS